MLPLLTLCAGVAVASAAPLGAVAARLEADRWVGAVALALGLHAVLTLTASEATPAGHLAVVALLLVAGVATDRRGRGDRLVVAGIVLLAVAHVTSAVATPGAPLLVAPPSLDLAASLVVLGGVVVLVRHALARLDATVDAQDEELRLAELHRAGTAERDHELRNGLAGLAGAARLLGDERTDRDLLDALVASELHRLDDLLRSRDGVPPAVPASSYAVAPVLDGLAALRRAAGVGVHLEADPGLRATGTPEALAQIVTNLIANAERHAPGSAVRITATAWGGRVVVRVRDFGPGLRAGQEDVVFEPGVRDHVRGGRGLGLHLCRRVLTREGGSISIGRAEPTGCVVTVDLPAAPSPAVRPPYGRRVLTSVLDEDDEDDAVTLPCVVPWAV